MKSINLKSLVEIYEHNKLTHCPKKQYFNFMGNEIKIVDIETLKNFIAEMLLAKVPVNFFNDFYFGYSIPQIGKEFDLLKFTNNSVLNIELKSKYTKNIQKQLIKNKYYLKFLNKEMHLYTYVAQDNTLWKLNNNDDLIQCNFQEIVKILEKIYFLITGQAGSGKTLLTYNIAKKSMESGLNVSIIHVGNLNNGHLILLNDFDWNIYAIKNWQTIFTMGSPDLIIIDEVQRMNNKNQFKEIISNISKNNSILIMSGDKAQTLGNNEGWAIDVSSVEKFELKGKVRTNKELANFIIVLLDLKRKHHVEISSQNINISFFDELKDAKQYIQTKTNYTYISYTPNTGLYSPLCNAHKYNFSEVGTSHQVVGQEFENVITILDPHFYYDENDMLKARKITHNPYSPLKMFFQQITRAINKLEIVVVKNIELYNRIMQIFE